MNSTAPPNGPPTEGRPSLDQIIWMGIGSNPGKTLVRLHVFDLCRTDETGMGHHGIGCSMYASGQDPFGYSQVLRSLWVQTHQGSHSHRSRDICRLVSFRRGSNKVADI
jgi:hypothetical protein